jgi:hypothetical protein
MDAWQHWVVEMLRVDATGMTLKVEEIVVEIESSKEVQ